MDDGSQRRFRAAPEGWRTHERDQGAAWLRLTHLQRLRWLDGAKRFAELALEAARTRNMGNPRAERAAARRAAGLPGQIIRAGASKGCLYAELTHEERLAAYWKLIQRSWIASGRQLPATRPRAELPGEVFRIRRNA